MTAPEKLTPTKSVVEAEVKIAGIKAIMLQNNWFDTPALVLKDEPGEKIYLP